LNWPDPPGAGDLGDGRPASALERPADPDALRHTVTTRVERGDALYPQGGRTSLDYGGIPGRPGVAIDLRGLDRVIDYPAADMTITVQAGVTLAALQATLAENHQRLPLDAPHPDRATLGGIYATNASGPRRFGAGRPRDLIIGVSFVTAKGAAVKGGGRVVKNVAGYDFPKLLTGSLGTLGIITQMTLKVRPAPEASAIAWAAFDGAPAAEEALERLNTSATRPIALEYLNRPAAQALGGATGLPVGGAVIVVGLEDNATSVAWQLDRLTSELGGSNLAVLGGAEALPLWASLADYQAAGTGSISFVANLKSSSVAPFAQGLDPALWAVQAHAGNGIVRGHWLGPAELEPIEAEIERLRVAARRDGGSVILSRCPTAWKERLRVWGEPRGDWALAERVKHAFDPEGVLNPGRFVGTI
jgi:glycolate oxidase FAD binding subunit